MKLNYARRTLLVTFLASVLSFVLFFAHARESENPYIDLHAHLFMNEGLGLLFWGDFDGPLKAAKWTDRLSSQANPESLEQSKLGLVVASLYATYPFVRSKRTSIRNQIKQAEEFVAKHPGWIIAKTAEEARRARSEDKRIIVFSLEGVSGVIETDEDIKEFVEQRGIRIVTFAHLTEDEFSGVAMLPSWHVLASPVTWLRSLFKPHRCEGAKTSTQGLTEKGRKLAKKLIKNKVWLDLTHASDESQRELIPMLEAAGQPLLYTHTTLRRHLPVERALADWQLEKVKSTGGMVGLMPADEMLEGTPTESSFLNEKNCQGGIYAMATHYDEIVRKIGIENVAIGTDTNGAINHLPPVSSQCATHTSLDNPQGYWNIGQTADLWLALHNVGALVGVNPADVIDSFISKWEKVSQQ